MPKKDEWDARFVPEAKRTRRRGNSRSQGLFLMILAIGIPVMVFFIQEDGVLRFYDKDQVFERTLTTEEKLEIRQAIDKHKAKLDKVQRIVEDIKDKYRGETGVSYDRDVWVVHVREGLAVPYKYIVALGALLFFLGIVRFTL